MIVVTRAFFIPSCTYLKYRPTLSEKPSTCPSNHLCKSCTSLCVCVSDFHQVDEKERETDGGYLLRPLGEFHASFIMFLNLLILSYWYGLCHTWTNCRRRKEVATHTHTVELIVDFASVVSFQLMMICFLMIVKSREKNYLFQ